MTDTLAPGGWRERLEVLAGRRRESVVVAVVVAVSVFASVGMWARGSPPVIAPPARATPSPEASTGPAGVLVVHVAGAVRNPGVFELPAGSRVSDAIDRAGGPAPRADLDLLNLAAFVADGTQILVPERGSGAAVGSSVPPGASPAATVNLNTADQTLLETVPGLGPVKAGAIVAYRTEIGGFDSIDQLLEVTGIGPATLESIRPFVSL